MEVITSALADNLAGMEILSSHDGFSSSSPVKFHPISRTLFDLSATATEIEAVAKQFFDLPATSSLVKEGDNGTMNGMDIHAKDVTGEWQWAIQIKDKHILCPLENLCLYRSEKSNDSAKPQIARKLVTLRACRVPFLAIKPARSS